MGLTSRSGIVPLNFHRDIGGPMARTVADAVKVFDVIAGHDPEDSYSVEGQRDPSYTSALVAGSLKGARIGVARFIIDASADPDVVKLFEQAVGELRREGAVIVDPFVVPDYSSIRIGGCNRFKFDLNDYLASRDPAPPVKDLAAILASRRFHPSIELRLRDSETATVHPKDNPQCKTGIEGEQQLRRAMLAAMDEAKVSAIVYPTWDNPPRLIGDLNTPHGDNSQVLSPATGFPAINVPIGFVRGELPLGMQFLGRAWSESTLIRLAFSYEQATRHRRPPESTPPLK
jgi:Asp-tRNA(Asn)/Glu-tRNA(Gln) amidotransferase A subunit family amidase